MGHDVAALASPGLHEKILELVVHLRGEAILDAPAGKGALTEKLLAAGKRVTAGDIDTERFGLPVDLLNLSVVRLDLNDTRLPLEDAAFDVAISAEGIEHLQSQWNLVRNLHRVLKSGGHLVLSTPNILNFASRLRYFLEGRYEHFKRPMVHEKSWAHDLENYHISPVSFFELQFMLESCGFEILELYTNRLKSKNLLSVAMRPFFRMVYRLKHSRDRKRQRGEHAQLYDAVMSDAVYYGECLIILACKADR